MDSSNIITRVVMLSALAVVSEEETRAAAASAGAAAATSRPTLDDYLNLSDFKAFFRITQEEYKAILPVLRLPDPVVTSARDSERSAIALLLVLAYLGGARLSAIRRIFCRSSGSCSRLINWTLSTIYRQWNHLLDIERATSGLLSPSHLDRYARALARKGLPLQGVWGYVDGALFPPSTYPP